MNLELELVDYAPDSRVARHTHARPVLAALLSGAMEIELRRRSHGLVRGAVFTRADEPHANRFGPRGARLLLVHLPGSAEVPSFVSDPRVGHIARALANELARSDSVAPLAREGLALQLWATAARGGAKSAKPEPWLRRVEAYIEANLLSPMSLAELAAVAQVHPVHLGRAFRAAHGEPLATHLRRRRIEWARQKLLETDEPLGEIALEAGFCDAGHFARVFRRFTGASPGSVRRTSR